MKPHTHKLTAKMQHGELVVLCKHCHKTEAEIKEAK
jgi:hypothetical protein